MLRELPGKTWYKSSLFFRVIGNPDSCFSTLFLYRSLANTITYSKSGCRSIKLINAFLKISKKSSISFPLLPGRRIIFLAVLFTSGGLKSEILDKKGFLSLVFSGAFALFGFLIGTPYALFDFKTFSRTDGPQGAFWQFTNVGSVRFMEHVGKFFTESFGRILTNTGYVVMPVYFIVLGYLIYKIVKKKTEERDFYLLFLYIVSLFLIWYESGFKNNRSHYYFIFYPFLALIFGFFVNCLRYKFSLGWPKENFSKLFSKIVVPILFAPLLISSISSSRAFVQKDTRNMLYDWLKKNYVSRDIIFYTDRDLKQIFDFVNARSVKGLSRYDKSGDSIIILSSQSTVEFKGVDSEFVKKEIRFDSKGKRGPDIEVYFYDGPDDVVKKENSGGGCGCGR